MKQNAVNKNGNAGFSLIEILVGMVIGLIGLIIMMQIFSFVEGQKRTTTGTGDAQNIGTTALYMLQRDIRLAGFGFNALSIIGCQLNLGGGKVPTLAPVIINPANIPAGDANTDTLQIAYGNGNSPTEGEIIVSTSPLMMMSDTEKGYKINDRVIVAPPSSILPSCSLDLATVTTVSGKQLALSSVSGNASSLFNLGNNPKILVYAIRSGNLTVCDYLVNNCADTGTVNETVWVPVANNIVSLRAQYGRDTTTPMNGIDLWDRTTPPAVTAPQSAPATPEEHACLWVRASAVRLAVVARNSQTEKEPVTLVPLTWDGSRADDASDPASRPKNPAPLSIDLSNRADWQNYRYRLYQTVIPIRNMPWITQCP